MRVIYLILFILLATLTARTQNVYYVSPTGNGAQNGASWLDAMTIANAINIVNADVNPLGSELRVLAGFYAFQNSFDLTKSVKILGGYNGVADERPASALTEFDGGSQTDFFAFGKTVTVDRIRFLNGKATETNVRGGAITITSDNYRITNCYFKNNVFSGNTGAGAIYTQSTDNGLIENCVFEQNIVVFHPVLNADATGSSPGAVNARFNNNLKVLNCKFSDNVSPFSGGALLLWQTDEAANNYVESCEFVANIAGGTGGAILDRRGGAIITNSAFSNNKGTRGGAIANDSDKSTRVDRSTFRNNTAEVGGALHIGGVNMDVVSTLFYKNSATEIGGALFTTGDINIVNCTFAENTNTAVATNRLNADQKINIHNSIFYQNTAYPNKSIDFGIQFSNPLEGVIDISNNILQDYTNGLNNQIGLNPQFIDGNTGNFNLTLNSFAVNAGSNSLFSQFAAVNPQNASDLIGNSRLVGNNIDLGAFEFNSTISKQPQTITANDIVKNVGDADFVHGSSSAQLPLSYVSSDPSIASVVTINNLQMIRIHKAGQVVITVSQLGNDTYLAAANVSFKLEVKSAKSITITFTAINKIYDGNTNATISFSTDADPNEEIIVNYQRANFDDKNVGSGKQVSIEGITISGADANKYTLSATSVKVAASILKKRLLVTAKPATKVYGDPDPTFLYDLDGLLPGEIVNGFLTRDLGEDAGLYTFLNADFSDASNYLLEFVSNKLTITKATLTVIASSQSVCDVIALNNMIIYEGFKFNDDESSLASLPTLQVGVVNSLGKAIISVIGGAANNYNFNYVSAELTIKPSENIPIVSNKGQYVLPGSLITLSVNPSSSSDDFVWTANGQILTNETGRSIIVNPAVETTYTVSETLANNCVVYLPIIIKTIGEVKIPNAFSPNGDGLNDTWEIEHLQKYERYSVLVFDRRGSVVYNSKKHSWPFNGRYYNSDLPIGVYYYVIDLMDNSSKLTGSVLIVR